MPTGREAQPRHALLTASTKLYSKNSGHFLAVQDPFRSEKTVLKNSKGCPRVGPNLAVRSGWVGSGKRVTGPDPRESEKLPTRPDTTQPVRFRKLLDPTRAFGVMTREEP